MERPSASYGLGERPPRWVETARSPVRMFARRTLIRNLAGTVFKPRGAERAELLARLQPLLELLDDGRRIDCGPDQQSAARRSERYYWPPLLEPDVELHSAADERTLLLLGGHDHVVFARISRCLDGGDALLKDLERRLELLGGCAVDEDYGLLTSSPRRCGDGESLEIFLHLPAVTAVRQLDRLAQGAAEQGFWLLPAGAPGGAVFVVNNLCALGYAPGELAERAEALAVELEAAELTAREALGRRGVLWLEDRIGRARGLPGRARRLEETEAATTCAWLRLGRSLGLLERPSWKALNTALWALQPALAAAEARRKGMEPAVWRAELLAAIAP